MEQQTLITLIGLAVTIVAVCVAMASFLYLFARNVKEDTRAQNVATRERLGERIDGVENQLGERIDGVANQLGERIDGVANQLGERIDGVANQLGERIDGVANQLGERIDGVANQLGERIDQLGERITKVEGKVDLMARADDVREGFAMLRGSLDTLERRTFDIATGTAEA